MMMASTFEPSVRPRVDANLVGISAAGLAFALTLATHLIDFGVYHLRVGALNSGYEWSFSHVAATLAFATGSVVCIVAAAHASEHRLSWAAAGTLFACLLVDNLLRLHEHVGAWPAFYAPVFVGLSIAILSVGRGTDVAALLYAGLGLLVCSLGIHIVGPTIVRSLGFEPTGWAYQIKVAVKEGTELAGWVLLVPALARLARSQMAAPPRRPVDEEVRAEARSPA
jgi:hypothetical protein